MQCRGGDGEHKTKMKNLPTRTLNAHQSASDERQQRLTVDVALSDKAVAAASVAESAAATVAVSAATTDDGSDDGV